MAKAIGAVSGVASVSAPVPGQRSPLVSADGRSSVVAATLQAAPNPNNVVKAIESALSGRHDVVLGGADVAGYQTGQQALADLGLAEALAFPLLAILALLIFRGLATLLPLAAGGMSVLVTFLVLRLVNEALPLSVFALNLVIGLGLGLSVDYTLFLGRDFRDELQDGRAVPEALRATLVSTGRTVLFSATTVAAALACLTIFPQRFLVSMGLGGAVVALVAAFSALLVVPALLMLFGARLGRKARSGTTSGSWYRLASAVMRRPWLFAAGTAVVLLLLASPAPKVRWSGIDATVLPTTKSARVAQDLLDRDFPGLHGGQPLLVVAEGPPSSGPALAGYVDRLASLPGVSSVSAARAIAPGTWEITLADQADPISAKAQATVATVRGLPAPATVLVGGAAADFYDQRATVDNTLPVALGALAGVVLLVLWAMTGSLVLPFKTLLMNGLTAAAATGDPGVHFPRRAPRWPSQLYGPGRHRRDRFPRAGGVGLRPLDRLRRVPAGGIKSPARVAQRRGCGRGHAEDREVGDQRLVVTGRGHRRFCHLPPGVLERSRGRHCCRGPLGRLLGPCFAGAVSHGTSWPVELVGTPAAAAAPFPARVWRSRPLKEPRCACTQPGARLRVQRYGKPGRA